MSQFKKMVDAKYTKAVETGKNLKEWQAEKEIEDMEERLTEKPRSNRPVIRQTPEGASIEIPAADLLTEEEQAAIAEAEAAEQAALEEQPVVEETKSEPINWFSPFSF